MAAPAATCTLRPESGSVPTAHRERRDVTWTSLLSPSASSRVPADRTRRALIEPIGRPARAAVSVHDLTARGRSRVFHDWYDDDEGSAAGPAWFEAFSA